MLLEERFVLGPEHSERRQRGLVLAHQRIVRLAERLVLTRPSFEERLESGERLAPRVDGCPQAPEQRDRIRRRRALCHGSHVPTDVRCRSRA